MKISDYKVLARKYRPSTFSDLLGQETLVQVIKNGIKNNKLPHAFIFTGVRGVGKTTTARLIARALNCVNVELAEPCGKCSHCKSITEDRHIDVIEMDAASQTGVDNIREIIESAKYKAVSGKYKVYIIDEVHMLSKSAFNALLKTLEEPPANLKFILATTEIRKVPETILSRCMRFDLNRINFDKLVLHLKNVSYKEQITCDDEAISLIAKTADGSVRDALSLLDQAISLSDGNNISIQSVKEMLGLFDYLKVIQLFMLVMKGQSSDVIDFTNKLYNDGADPTVIIQDLLDFIHLLTISKSSNKVLENSVVSEEKRKKVLNILPQVTMSTLIYSWQILFKGLQEVQIAPVPIQACQMILIRLIYINDLPEIKEIISSIKDDETLIENQSYNIMNLEQLRELLIEKENVILLSHIRDYVDFVNFRQGSMELYIKDNAPPNIIVNLSSFLKKWTNQLWDITLSKKEHGGITKDMEEEVKQQPIVKTAMNLFPGTTIEIQEGEKHNE